jgi:hypothetical protein
MCANSQAGTAKACIAGKLAALYSAWTPFRTGLTPNPMDSHRRPLSSLDAWPGEAARPPLRLLETPRSRPNAGVADRRASSLAGWLQRLRHALLAG